MSEDAPMTPADKLALDLGYAPEELKELGKRAYRRATEPEPPMVITVSPKLHRELQEFFEKLEQEKNNDPR